jgi:hypothetical protein
VGEADAGKLMSVYSHRNVPVRLDKQKQRKKNDSKNNNIIIIKERTKEGNY